MVALLLALFALILSLFGLYAFIRELQRGGSSSTSATTLMDLAETSGLPADVKKLYQKTVVEILAPAVHRTVAREYAKAVKTTPYPEMEKQAVAAATALAATIESKPVETFQTFGAGMRMPRFF